MIEIDESLVEEASKLDKSSVNRSNICFSRLSMKIAKQLLSSSSSSSSLDMLTELEKKFTELATLWNDTSSSSGSCNKNKPPFCCVEGVAYAVNATKVQLIQDAGHVMITVPYYGEFERGMPATDDNPNGEESPIQKMEEVLFLLSFNNKLSMNLMFVNDVIAEKKDEKNGGGSSKLFKRSILEYLTSNGLEFTMDSDNKPKTTTDGDVDFDCLHMLDGQLTATFTSCEAEAAKGSPYETPAEKQTRFENRDPATGQLRERKGGAVLAGMERLDLPAKFTDQPLRVVRCLVDGDSAHPIASFVGDAAYAILEQHKNAYLGNMKHPSTCISMLVAAAGEEDCDCGGASAATHAKVQHRKLFFSGFIVPVLFPELSLQYNYTGTTQLPIKAFRGDLNFAKAKLSTVQPNVDLGLLALLCSHLNAMKDTTPTIASGPVTIRDNVASSTMTTDDLHSEWTKTYGPIFTSAVGLCRDLKPMEFETLPGWLTTFIETMELKHYTTLFGEEAATNPDVLALFATMKTFRDAPDRAAVLEELRKNLDTIFPASSSYGGGAASVAGGNNPKDSLFSSKTFWVTAAVAVAVGVALALQRGRKK